MRRFVRHRCARSTGWLLIVSLIGIRLAAAEDRTTTVLPPLSARIGPSFTCPTPKDPLGQLICANPRLAVEDLAFVQAYQALRQQSSPTQQASLRGEAVNFGKAMRTECGVAAPAGAADALPRQPTGDASACVERAYARQRAAWLARLDGVAAEEARRGLGDHLSLQRDLQVVGLLPQGEPINGVYDGATRAAIVAFQQTMGRAATGLIGDEDALALSRQAMAHPNARSAPSAPAAKVQHSSWDDFQADAVAIGITVVSNVADACLVEFRVQNPDALADATREFQRRADMAVPPDNAAKLFAAEMNFLRTQFAARGIHAFYAAEPPGTDRCRFEAMAFTIDIYGRDVAQPLFSFEFDRATYAKIVWPRFDVMNLPRIMLAFQYAAYATQRLGGVDKSQGPLAPP